MQETNIPVGASGQHCNSWPLLSLGKDLRQPKELGPEGKNLVFAPRYVEPRLFQMLLQIYISMSNI